MKILTLLILIFLVGCNNGTTTQVPARVDTFYATKHDTVPRNCPPNKTDTVIKIIHDTLIKIVHDTVPKQCPPCPTLPPCDSTKWNITSKDTLLYIPMYTNPLLKKYIQNGQVKVTITHK